MTSLGGSITGSFDHGVRRLVWLLPAQEEPRPDSETRQPKAALASTFTHGAGGISSPTRITYSRPPAVKPPLPLSKTKAAGDGVGAGLAWPFGSASAAAGVQAGGN